VEAALELLLSESAAITYESVKAMVTTAAQVAVPALAPSVVDLHAYDALLEEVGT
jgi:hypothetical protein